MRPKFPTPSDQRSQDRGEIRDRPEFKNSTDFQNAFDALARTFDLHRRIAMDP